MLTRRAVERVIAGSCLLHPGYLSKAQVYLSIKSFKDPLALQVYSWALKNPSAYALQPSVLKAMLEESGIKKTDLVSILAQAVCPSQLDQHCLILLEMAFRDEAVRILKSNRNEALVPLAPVEKDVANPMNEVWAIVTMASNYCYDANLPAIGDQLSLLLTQMNEKASSLKLEEKIRYHIAALRELLAGNPEMEKKYKHSLKNLAFPYE